MLNQKHTPLHWAAFKGHNRIVCLLLTAGIDPEIRDQLGNTALHQACAGGSVDVIKTLLSRGVDLLAKNARGHLPILLCTATAAHALLKKGMDSKQCSATGKQFSAAVKKYMCLETGSFFCAEAVVSKLVLENAESEYPEKIATWSLPVAARVDAAERALEEAINGGDAQVILHALNSALNLPLSPLLISTARKAESRIRAEMNLAKSLGFEKLENADEYAAKLGFIKSAISAAKSSGVDDLKVEEAKTFSLAIAAQQVLQKNLGKSADSLSLEKILDSRNSPFSHLFDSQLIGIADQTIKRLQGEEKLRGFLARLNLDELTSSSQVEVAAADLAQIAAEAADAGVEEKLLHAAREISDKLIETLSLRKTAEEAALKKKKRKTQKKK